MQKKKKTRKQTNKKPKKLTLVSRFALLVLEVEMGEHAELESCGMNS